MIENEELNVKLISLQESTVQTLSAGMILGLTAGYNFHPCKRGKTLLLCLLIEGLGEEFSIMLLLACSTKQSLSILEGQWQHPLGPCAIHLHGGK